MGLEEGTRRDVAAVRAVRAAVGPAARLMIDANNGYNFNLARRVLQETRECDIWWIEEAFHEDPVLYALLRAWLREQGMPTLIADGEGVASPLMLQWALEGAVDCLQFSAREKGFTEWLRLARLLRAAERTPAPHNFGSHWTCFAAGHLAAQLEGRLVVCQQRLWRRAALRLIPLLLVRFATGASRCQSIGPALASSCGARCLWPLQSTGAKNKTHTHMFTN